MSWVSITYNPTIFSCIFWNLQANSYEIPKFHRYLCVLAYESGAFGESNFFLNKIYKDLCNDYGIMTWFLRYALVNEERIRTRKLLRNNLELHNLV